MVPDFLIIGGGVIGLTTAYELASLGASVKLIDRQQVGREASWAGAGMLPPALCSGPPALRQLMKRSRARWASLTEELHSHTGIDNGYRECGALQISIVNRSSIPEEAALWQKQDVPVNLLNRDELIGHECELGESIQTGFRLPTMGQVRNPDHIAALKNACEKLSVEIIEDEPISHFEFDGSTIRSANSSRHSHNAGKYILCSGAWSPQISQSVGIHLEIEPVRGQIVLMKFDEQRFSHIIEDGPRYLVPRDDGHVLIGSTEERVGFVKETTSDGIRGLVDFAFKIIPALKDAELVKTWAGFRPATLRRIPYIGASEKYNNLIIAAGHYRDGLAQSPETGKLISDIAMNRSTAFDVTALGI